MPRIAYTVTADLRSAALARRYVAWLRAGHVRAVVAGGALSAVIVALEASPGQRSRRVEVRYMFASRAALRRYLKHRAPALRAAGLARFGPATGTVFTRAVGEVRAQAARAKDRRGG